MSYHCLLADTISTDARVALLMALASVIGGAAAWLFNALTAWRQAKRAERREDEKTIVDHLETLAARVTSENRELHEELNALRDDLTAERVKAERLLGHVKYLQEMMRSRRMAFKDYESPGDGPPAAPQARAGGPSEGE